MTNADQDYLNLLLDKISRSLFGRKEVAKELRLLTKRMSSFRGLFESTDAIPQLLNPLQRGWPQAGCDWRGPRATPNFFFFLKNIYNFLIFLKIFFKKKLGVFSLSSYKLSRFLQTPPQSSKTLTLVYLTSNYFQFAHFVKIFC